MKRAIAEPVGGKPAGFAYTGVYIKLFLIAGLGNPGAKYADTYHNLGFKAADAVAAALGFTFKPARLADVADGYYRGARVTVIRPTTFMNLSGAAVRGVMAARRAPAENVLVIYDDADIPRGTLRLRAAGGPGTHNGMRNITETLGTENFKRLRVGAGPVPEGTPLADFVLSEIGAAEAEVLKPALSRAAAAAVAFAGGADFADVMNEYNK